MSIWTKWFARNPEPEALPEFWREYLAYFKHPLELKVPLSEVRFVVLDTETSGLDVNKDRILSIGAVVVKGAFMVIEESFECYLNQIYEPVHAAVEVHGILPVKRESSLEEKDAISRFLLYLGNAVLVGHNISFDVQMINAALKTMGAGKLKNRTIDTIRLAQRLQRPDPFHRGGEYSLDNLCLRYGIPLNQRHTASGDAFMTGLLFMKLTGRLENRGVRTLGDLLKKPII